MKKGFLIAFTLSNLVISIAAQKNWAAIPCFRPMDGEAIDKMFVDSLHNKLILYSNSGSTICNTTYKGLFAYNGHGFHDLDYGVNKHNLAPAVGGLMVLDCITNGNKTLFGGFFQSVGSKTLYSKSIALWNGTVWDTFPTHCFSNKINYSGGGFYGFLKHNGKLWMYGGFDTIGNTITKNLVAYNGNTFTACPPIPVNQNSPITKMIVYKNKLIAAGLFYEYPSNSISRLAMYDGTSWASVGTGVVGNIAFINAMAVYKDTLYIGGEWPKGGGNAGNNIIKWDGSKQHDAGFGNFCGWGGIRKLIVYRDRLYAFGAFMCAANQKAFGVAYYEKGKWTVPQDSVQGWGIIDAAVYNDEIYIGGGFRSINGDTVINSFAKLRCPDFDPASGCLSGLKESVRKLEVKLFPNPSSDKLHMEYDQTPALDKISILNTLGQEVFNLVKPLPRQEIDVSHLPAGVYFLKAENKQGQGVFKVVKE